MAIVSTKNAQHYQWGQGCDGWPLVKSDNLSVIQELIPSGAGEVLHLHNKAEQFFYVLSGVATLMVEGTVHILNSGEGLHVLPNQAHQLRNDGSEELSFLVTSTPPSHGDRVEVSRA